VDLEIDEEEAICLGAGTVVGDVLVGGGLEAEGGERDGEWVASGRKVGVMGGDVTSDYAWEVTSCLRCEVRTMRHSSRLKQTPTSQWR
jgi:hypothetical protein